MTISMTSQQPYYIFLAQESYLHYSGTSVPCKNCLQSKYHKSSTPYYSDQVLNSAKAVFYDLNIKMPAYNGSPILIYLLENRSNHTLEVRRLSS